MFLDQPDTDFTLAEWIACRDYYLRVSREPGLPENLLFACRWRARFAAENIRRSVREIDKLNAEFYWPVFNRR